MPKQIHEIKDLRSTARRRDARSVTMKRSKDFIRCVFDQAKATSLQSLPSGENCKWRSKASE
ncbi:unnamed protein product [Arabidopsis halleri]